MKLNLRAVRFLVANEQFILFEWSRDKVLPNDLTHAEREVAKLICQGLSIPEIAHMRGTKKRTVENQVYMIYQKCGLESSRTETSSSLYRRFEFIT